MPEARKFVEATWMPYITPIIQGLNKEIGNFYVSLDGRNEILIKITTPAYDSDNFYSASIKLHYDGLATMRELERCGFLKRFEETSAQTFYDVFYCFHASGIRVLSFDTDDELLPSRKMYELLHRLNGE